MRTTRTSRQRILHVAGELFPLQYIGGLGAYTHSVLKAQRQYGFDARIAVPWFSGLRLQSEATETLTGTVSLGPSLVPYSLSTTQVDGVPVWLVQSPAIHTAWFEADEPEHHVGCWAFSLALVDVLRRSEWKPDVVHCHDYHSGLIPRWVSVPSVMTIHSARGQSLVRLGRVPDELRDDGLSGAPDFDSPRAPYVNLLRQGITAATLISTVSPSYRRELLRDDNPAGLPAPYSLANVLEPRRRAFRGILNGINDVGFRGWRSADVTAEKQKRRRWVSQRLGLELTSGPLVVVVARIDAQKSFDLMLPVIPWLVRREASVVLMGNGPVAAQNLVDATAAEHPGRVVSLRFDAELEHHLYPAADLTLIPSRFEPCGTTQLRAMAWGCLPVARATGGLRDTIRHGETGFLFKAHDQLAFLKALATALANHGTAYGRRMRRNAIREDNRWAARMPEYESIYLRATKAFRPSGGTS